MGNSWPLENQKKFVLNHWLHSPLIPLHLSVVLIAVSIDSRYICSVAIIAVSIDSFAPIHSIQHSQTSLTVDRSSHIHALSFVNIPVQPTLLFIDTLHCGCYSFDCFSVDCQWELKTTVKVQGIRIIETHNLFENLLWNESVSWARHCNRIYETLAWNTAMRCPLIEICRDMRDCNRVSDT